MASFSDQLQRYLEQIGDLRQRGASEDSIRDAFLGFLRGAFPRLAQAEPILLEKHVPALRVRGGFADALYGDLIFECKKRLDDQSRAEGQEELTRYVHNQKHPEHYLGILTDGETLEVYALRGEELAAVDRLSLAAGRAAEARLWLDCYLFHEKHLTPTAEDVALRFGERSPTFWRSIRILQDLWGQAGLRPAAQTKFAEWQSLLSIVYGSQVGDEALFLRHTYLALFARVLAYVALERRAPGDKELTGLLTGETFQDMGLDNFVEDDFFTWVSDPTSGAATRGLLHAMATRLTAAYDLGAIREDLLKELYQELVDPQTRHDLGEFYTPDWLAELTLRKAGFPPSGEGRNPSLLDPSCGSGTFLFTAVRLLREAGWKGKALVEFCSQHLAGIDVHPLAVAIAKTNVLLALGKDLQGHPKRLALPIYMADTLSAAMRPALQENVVHVAVDVDTLAKQAGKAKSRSLASEFDLPDELANKPELLSEALNALFQFAEPQISEADALEGFQMRLEELGLANGKSTVWRANLGLMRWLMRPPATDTVWRFVLRNAYQPALLARRKFAFVAGNPPWLSYRYIKRPDYQQRVRELVFQNELLEKRQANFFTQMDLATLFFAFAAHHYLAEGGTLAFVLPRSILTGAKQHAAFRERYVAEAELLIDCEQVSPLFNVPSCVVLWRKSPTDQTESTARTKRIPMQHLQGQLPSRNAPLGQARECWISTDTVYRPLLSETGSPYLAEIIQGATIVPRSLWFVRPPEAARVLDRRQPRLETDRSVHRQAKAPWKGIRLNGSVESEFLFSTLLCDNLLPFGQRHFSLVVLPLVKEQGAGLHLINPTEAVRRGKIGLRDWLLKAEAAWAKHGKASERVRSIYDRFDFGRCLTRQHPTGVVKVLYNDAGTHISACVTDTRDVSAWRLFDLPVRGFLAEHVTYWFETQSLDEGHYLCAMLNAPRIDAAIKPYQTKGVFGAQRGEGQRHVGRRPFEVLPIPRFAKSDKRHRQLARLSLWCHDKVREVVAAAGETWLKAPVGRVRSQLRAEVLQRELAEIDRLTAEILGT